MMGGMSIVVDLDKLADAVARHATAFLLVSADERPHVGEVEVRVRDGVVAIARPGRTSTAVVAERPKVTLLLPPYEPDGYTLLIDGTAEVVDDEMLLTPSHAVLHRRPRPDSQASPTGCEGDCRPIG